MCRAPHTIFDFLFPTPFITLGFSTTSGPKSLYSFIAEQAIKFFIFTGK